MENSETRYRITFKGSNLGFFSDKSIVKGKEAANKEISTYKEMGFSVVKLEYRNGIVGEWKEITA